MKLFTILRYGVLMDTRIEKEDIIEADSYGVHDGMLTFYRNLLTLSAPESIATYAQSAWIKVSELKEKSEG